MPARLIAGMEYPIGRAMVWSASERIRPWLRAAFWVALAVAVFFAVDPRPPQLPIDRFGDKFAHMLAFATLAGLAVLAFPALKLRQIVLRLALLGAAIEIVQAIPVLHRDSDVRDWVADMVAVLVALAAARLLERCGLFARAP